MPASLAYTIDVAGHSNATRNPAGTVRFCSVLFHGRQPVLGEESVRSRQQKGSEWWAVQDSNLRPPACKAGALTG